MGKFQFWLPTKLTRQQARAVDSDRAIFLTGVPGTGKTVVSIFKLRRSKKMGKKSILFTYGKLLKKTIIEKLVGDEEVDNIHNWLWNLQEKHREYLEVLLSDENIKNTIEVLKSKNIWYDEILVDEGQDLSINTYKLLSALTDKLSISADQAQQINNGKNASDEDEIKQLLPNLREYELDEIFRSSYELYVFAIQFVLNNARAHNPSLLERLKKNNSGADKPYVYLVQNLDAMYETIRDIIDENPTDNIGILFEEMLPIDQFAAELRKDYELSTYHSIQKVVPSELKNILITTFKSAKGVEFDIVIIPHIQGSRVTNEEYYVGVTRAKYQVHFLAIGDMPEIIKDFNEDSYKLIDEKD